MQQNEHQYLLDWTIFKHSIVHRGITVVYNRWAYFYGHWG